MTATSRRNIIGWQPPGCGDPDNAVVPLLSDLVDTTDPAFPEIAKVLVELQSLEIELDAEMVQRAIRVGRKRCEASGKYWARVRARRQLSQSTIDAEATSLVYYMRIGNRVKIGTTTNLAERMKSIYPEELMAIESGGYQLEQDRHAEFSRLRTHGEWFRLEEPLTTHIENLQGASASN